MANKHEKIISLVDHCGNKNSNQLNQLILHTHLERLKKKKNLNKRHGLPGGPVVKNPTVNAGDTGLIPSGGRFHMPQGN